MIIAEESHYFSGGSMSKEMQLTYKEVFNDYIVDKKSNKQILN